MKTTFTTHQVLFERRNASFVAGPQQQRMEEPDVQDYDFQDLKLIQVYEETVFSVGYLGMRELPEHFGMSWTSGWDLLGPLVGFC